MVLNRGWCELDKPRRPRKNASAAEWDRFHTDMAAWKDQQNNTSRTGWTPGHNGTLNGQPAEIQQGNTGRPARLDIYWPSGDPEYGHLVTNDGVNANYLREPGMAPGQYLVDDRQDDPYGNF